MHPREFIWACEAYQEKLKIQKRGNNGITEDEAMEMADELRHARVAAGYPAE